MPRLSKETRQSLRRLAAEGNDWAGTMLDLFDGPNVSPEVFAARMAEIDRVTNGMPTDAPRLWQVSRPLRLRARDRFRLVEIPSGTTLSYEHRGPAQSFRDDFGCSRSVGHRFRVVDGPETGREVEYTERWETEADDCADLRCTSPFPPVGLDPVKPS